VKLWGCAPRAKISTTRMRPPQQGQMSRVVGASTQSATAPPLLGPASRKGCGVSQSALAAKAGVGQGYLSDIENRRRKGAPETLARLARSLDVPVKWVG
jgi:DNA-binding XRE family transcriptional regulator